MSGPEFKIRALSGSCSKCTGVSMFAGHCLAHLSGEELSLAAQRLRQGAALDARGVEISQATLASLYAHLKVGNGVELPKCDFGGATFIGPIDFTRLSFAGEARFSDATFEDDVRFGESRFNGVARFRGASFKGRASFFGVQFKAGVDFVEARVSAKFSCEHLRVGGPASFSRLRTDSDASFLGAAFESANFSRAEFFGPVKFSRAEFVRNVDFRKAEFGGVAICRKMKFGAIAFFEGTRFHDKADFQQAEFSGAGRFHGALFGRRSWFSEAEFLSSAGFAKATFKGKSTFSNVRFGGSARFHEARFRAVAAFGGTVFEREANFEKAVFTVARFAGVRFEGEIWFGGARCENLATFRRASFRRAREFGPLEGGRIDLDGAVFRDHVKIEVRAKELTAVGATFAAGTHLRVAGADILLDEADFVRQSTVLGHGRPARLLSLRGAHVAPLILADLDLRSCLFFGAHGLESMRVEATCLWPSCPPGEGGGRETIAEEHFWRGWGSAEGRDGSSSPEQIAAVYRALRKGREDNKDEAGAGDLYYGEMEMRRHAKTSAGMGHRSLWGERAVLTSYWLVSGYGLRAARALAWLVVLLLVGAALLCWFGFHDSSLGYGRGVLFAVESSISLLRPPETSLSAGGQAVQIALRLLGPLLFGLALLAVRARVKR